MLRKKERQHNIGSEGGFTLLELIVTLGVVVVLLSAVSPSYDGWIAKKTLQNGYTELKNQLAEARSAAISRNTTSRMLLQLNAGTYTLTGFISAAPVTGCTPAQINTQIFTRQMDLSDLYQITGTGVGNICFYRDGSSNGASYLIDQVTMGGTDLGSAQIDVTIATGYIDATTDF